MFLPNNKITLRLKGGLGNQLFQYAAARAMADRLGLNLVLDVSAFKSDNTFHRKFELSDFRIRYDGLIHTAIFQRIKKKLKLSSKALELSDISIVKTYQERHKMLNEGNFVDTVNASLTQAETKQNYILDGYFQSEKYFYRIKDRIKNELQIKYDLPDKNGYLKSILSRKNPVCIGIRRYNEAEKSSVHYKLDIDYYNTALKKISSLVQDPHFFIFTLDQEWARNHLNLDENYTFVAPSVNPSIDLCLMKNCKHFIIPNSTYFWWGAWLCNYKTKIVISSKKGWANEFTIQDNWIQI